MGWARSRAGGHRRHADQAPPAGGPIPSPIRHPGYRGASPRAASPPAATAYGRMGREEWGRGSRGPRRRLGPAGIAAPRSSRPPAARSGEVAYPRSIRTIPRRPPGATDQLRSRGLATLAAELRQCRPVGPPMPWDRRLTRRPPRDVTLPRPGSSPGPPSRLRPARRRRALHRPSTALGHAAMARVGRPSTAAHRPSMAAHRPLKGPAAAPARPRSPARPARPRSLAPLGLPPPLASWHHRGSGHRARSGRGICPFGTYHRRATRRRRRLRRHAVIPSPAPMAGSLRCPRRSRAGGYRCPGGGSWWQRWSACLRSS
jgi:hypothetical protein